MTNHEIKRCINQRHALYLIDNEFLRNEADRRGRRIDMNNVHDKVGFLNQLLENNEVPEGAVVLLSK